MFYDKKIKDVEFNDALIQVKEKEFKFIEPLETQEGEPANSEIENSIQNNTAATINAINREIVSTGIKNYSKREARTAEKFSITCCLIIKKTKTISKLINEITNNNKKENWNDYSIDLINDLIELIHITRDESSQLTTDLITNFSNYTIQDFLELIHFTPRLINTETLYIKKVIALLKEPNSSIKEEKRLKVLILTVSYKIIFKFFYEACNSILIKNNFTEYQIFDMLCEPLIKLRKFAFYDDLKSISYFLTFFYKSIKNINQNIEKFTESSENDSILLLETSLTYINNLIHEVLNTKLDLKEPVIPILSLPANLIEKENLLFFYADLFANPNQDIHNLIHQNEYTLAAAQTLQDQHHIPLTRKIQENPDKFLNLLRHSYSKIESALLDLLWEKLNPVYQSICLQLVKEIKTHLNLPEDLVLPIEQKTIKDYQPLVHFYTVFKTFLEKPISFDQSILKRDNQELEKFKDNISHLTYIDCDIQKILINALEQRLESNKTRLETLKFDRIKQLITKVNEEINFNFIPTDYEITKTLIQKTNSLINELKSNDNSTLYKNALDSLINYQNQLQKQEQIIHLNHFLQEIQKFLQTTEALNLNQIKNLITDGEKFKYTLKSSAISKDLDFSELDQTLAYLQQLIQINTEISVFEQNLKNLNSKYDKIKYSDSQGNLKNSLTKKYLNDYFLPLIRSYQELQAWISKITQIFQPLPQALQNWIQILDQSYQKKLKEMREQLTGSTELLSNKLIPTKLLIEICQIQLPENEDLVQLLKEIYTTLHKLQTRALANISACEIIDQLILQAAQELERKHIEKTKQEETGKQSDLQLQALQLSRLSSDLDSLLSLDSKILGLKDASKTARAILNWLDIKDPRGNPWESAYLEPKPELDIKPLPNYALPLEGTLLEGPLKNRSKIGLVEGCLLILIITMIQNTASPALQQLGSKQLDQSIEEIRSSISKALRTFREKTLPKKDVPAFQQYFLATSEAIPADQIIPRLCSIGLFLTEYRLLDQLFTWQKQQQKSPTWSQEFHLLALGKYREQESLIKSTLRRSLREPLEAWLTAKKEDAQVCLEKLQNQVNLMYSWLNSLAENLANSITECLEVSLAQEQVKKLKEDLACRAARFSNLEERLDWLAELAFQFASIPILTDWHEVLEILINYFLERKLPEFTKWLWKEKNLELNELLKQVQETKNKQEQAENKKLETLQNLKPSRKEEALEEIKEEAFEPIFTITLKPSLLELWREYAKERLLSKNLTQYSFYSNHNNPKNRDAYKEAPTSKTSKKHQSPKNQF